MAKKFRGQRVLCTLTPTQTTKFEVMKNRLGAKDSADGFRRIVEALWAAHETGKVNLDSIRYEAMLPPAHPQRSVKEWMSQEPT